MTLREQQEVFIGNVAKLITFIFSNGYTCTGGELYRTKEQAEWYAERGTGIKDSMHCDRLAIDLNLFKNGQYAMHDNDYKFAGDYWESLNSKNRWGGRFADGNHFEMRRVYE